MTVSLSKDILFKKLLFGHNSEHAGRVSWLYPAFWRRRLGERSIVRKSILEGASSCCDDLLGMPWGYFIPAIQHMSGQPPHNLEPWFGHSNDNEGDGVRRDFEFDKDKELYAGGLVSIASQYSHNIIHCIYTCALPAQHHFSQDGNQALQPLTIPKLALNPLQRLPKRVGQGILPMLETTNAALFISWGILPYKSV